MLWFAELCGIMFRPKYTLFRSFTHHHHHHFLLFLLGRKDGAGVANDVPLPSTPRACSPVMTLETTTRSSATAHRTRASGMLAAETPTTIAAGGIGMRAHLLKRSVRLCICR